MKNMRLLAPIFITFCLFIVGCTFNHENSSTKVVKERIEFTDTYWKIPVKHLNDSTYPNNPDIAIRHSKDGSFYHDTLLLVSEKDSTYTFYFLSGNGASDTLLIRSLDLQEWIPYSAEAFRGNKYLTEIGLRNQEWNRHQVKFFEGQFKSIGENGEASITKRIDLARNCLNAYLWEIITYAEEEGKLKPVYHGWFDFPHELYEELFNKRNPGIAYADHKSYLEEWVIPGREFIDFTKLRKIVGEVKADFEDLSDAEYPFEGERKKKFVNILYPKNTRVMRDFQTDSASFATFSPPGFYDQSDPRPTQLGRFAKMHSCRVRRIQSIHGDTLDEVELSYSDEELRRVTRLVIGGFDIDSLPVLDPKDVNKGFQMPMGIHNHSFYETFDYQQAHPVSENSFFALLVDENREFFESHNIGIDGPVLHIDNKDPNLLHVWILSFERHAFIGHYIIKMS